MNILKNAQIWNMKDNEFLAKLETMTIYNKMKQWL